MNKLNDKKQKIIVLFDGICVLCNTAVYQLKKNLDEEFYSFIPSQSPEGENLISLYDLKNLPNDSVVVINEREVLIKSRAIMFLLRDMPLKWRILKIFSIFPERLLDHIYDLIAKNRQLIFNRKNERLSCEHEFK